MTPTKGSPALMPGWKHVLGMLGLSSLIMLVLAQGAAAADTPSVLETAALFGTQHGDAYTSIFLNQLFGPLFPAANGSTTKTVFSEIIGYFNIIMLVVGGILFFWNVTIGIMQSAHEGSVLGQRWSSLWAPLRVIFAVGLMVPTLNGYNLAQNGVAYIVRGSTNIASAIWGASAELVISGEAPITADPPQIDPKIVATLFNNAACQAIVNQQFATATGGAAGVGITTRVIPSPDGTRTTRMSAVQAADGSLSHMGLCGSSSTPELPRYITSISDGASINGIPESARAGIQSRFIAAHQGSMQMLETDLANIANNILPAAMDNGAPIPDISSGIISAWQRANANLENEIDALTTLAVGTDRQGQASRDALLNRIKGTCSENAPADISNPSVDNDSVKCYGEGWIGAGSWYMMLAQLNNELASLTYAKATASEGNYIRIVGDGARDLYIASGGETGWFIDETDRAYAAGFATEEEASLWMARMMESYSNSTAGLAALGFPMSTDHLGELNKNVDGGNFLSKIPGYSYWRTWVMETILEMTSPGQWAADPMIGLTKLGNALINLSAVLIGVAFIGGLFTGGSVATVMTPFIGILLAAGATLSFILPIMPFFFWVLAVSGYFLLIIEAVIAVNLWALGHMRMDGEGVSGEAGRMGWLMLLSLLMTPVLMVFGFLIGMSIFRITSALIDLGINQAISGIMGSGPFVEFGAILCFGVLITVLYMTLLERSFSLVSEFPGRVLRWMGADANITSGEEKQVRMAAAGAAGAMYKAGATPANAAHRLGAKYGFSAKGTGERDASGGYAKPGFVRGFYDSFKTSIRGPGRPGDSG